jgi:hypothetical protein
MHLRSLENFDFDTVMLPYNFCQMQNRHYASTFACMVDLCRQKNVAIQTIKSIARRAWGTHPRTYNPFFYEPLDTQDAIEKSVHWALGLPGSFVVSAGDIQLVPKILEAASNYAERPSDEEMKRLLSENDIHPVFLGW